VRLTKTQKSKINISQSISKASFFGLDDSEKEKSGLFVEDLCTLQNGHRVRDPEVYAHERLRVQLSPFLDLAGCTATRRKALVDVQYKDIEFQLFLLVSQGVISRNYDDSQYDGFGS
jgi:hypothetical protein